MNIRHNNTPVRSLNAVLLLLFSVIFSVSAFGVTPQEALDKLLSSPSIKKDNMGIMVYDLDKNKMVVSHNVNASLIPASVMKAVTNATLKRVINNTNKRLSTKVYANGKITGDVLDGNILIVCSGDPTINSTKGPESPDFVKEVVNGLKKHGIKKITGRVVFDEKVFPGPVVPPSWAAGDLSTYYGTGLHGFNFESNATGKSAVKDPASVFKTKLNKALQNEGIVIEGAVVEPGNAKKMIAEHRSAILEDIMRSCMVRSDNLYAEALQRYAAIESGKDGSNATAASVVTEYWKNKKAPMTGVNIVDGSGLSRQNRLTPNFLGDVLKKMENDAVFVSLFPLVGEEGTVRAFLKDTRLQGYMALKTGSMNGVQCYAGYALDDDYVPTHVVVVMVNNLQNRDNFKKALANFFLEIF